MNDLPDNTLIADIAVDIPNRVKHALHQLGVTTIKEARNLSEQELLRTANFGIKSLNDFRSLVGKKPLFGHRTVRPLTISVRIAVRIYDNGDWSAVGYNDMSDETAKMSIGQGQTLHWVTAEIPVPVPQELQGVVEKNT